MKRLGVVAIVVLLVGACSVADDALGSTSAPVTPPQTSIVVPADTTTSIPATTTPAVVTTVPVTTAASSIDPVLVVTIAEGEVISEFTQSVMLGSHISIVITSDVADEVHLHTYDLKGNVSAGGELVFEFDADIPGVFEMELEGSHLQVLELTVAP